jgi:predicted lipid-binding transport protein (Tim44 family)
VSDDRFGPDLEARLRAELDRVQPPHSSPRYLAAPPRPLTGRLAPALLAVSVIGILALSAFVASGSANPAVWGHDVVTIIQSSSTTPTPTTHAPSPTQTPKSQPVPSHRSDSPRPTERPEPTEPAEDAHQSPEPSDGHSGEGSASGDGGGDSHDGETSDSGDVQRS